MSSEPDQAGGPAAQPEGEEALPDGMLTVDDHAEPDDLRRAAELLEQRAAGHELLDDALGRLPDRVEIASLARNATDDHVEVAVTLQVQLPVERANLPDSPDDIIESAEGMPGTSAADNGGGPDVVSAGTVELPAPPRHPAPVTVELGTESLPEFEEAVVPEPRDFDIGATPAVRELDDSDVEPETEEDAQDDDGRDEDSETDSGETRTEIVDDIRELCGLKPDGHHVLRKAGVVALADAHPDLPNAGEASELTMGPLNSQVGEAFGIGDVGGATKDDFADIRAQLEFLTTDANDPDAEPDVPEEDDQEEQTFAAGDLDPTEYNEDLTPDRLAEALAGCQSVFQFQRNTRVAYEPDARDLLEELGLLEELRDGAPAITAREADQIVERATGATINRGGSA